MNTHPWRRRILSLALTAGLTAQLTGGALAAGTGTVPTVKSIRLIEEDYIEILWSEPVQNSVLQGNYAVTVNGQTAELSQCYYYDKLGDNMTSLRLADELADPESAQITLTVVNDGTEDIQTEAGATAEAQTYAVRYEPFYTQIITSELGIPVKGSENVDPKALELAAETVDFMLSKHPELAQTMVEHGTAVGLTARDENAYYLPEYRDSTDASVDPARGLGGNVQRPITAIAQDEVLQNEYSLYPRENVLVHEFGHCIKALGVAFYPDLLRDYEDVFIHAKQSGLWSNASYLNSNQEEFFACLSNIWFETVNDREDSTAFVNTKEELAIYDPMAYEFFSALYPDAHLPEECWDYDTKFANEVVISQAPDVQEPQEPVDPDEAGLPPEDYDLDTDYFKILSYLGSNVVQSEAGEVSTWWDFSDSWLNYNFDALSWKVTKVGDYYRFTLKKTDTVTQDLALMPENSGTAVGTVVTVGPVDENDDSQLWKLVRTKGYLCQMVNKASGLVLGTQGGVLPADGTPVVLSPYSDDPTYGNQWKVIRLKDAPEDESLKDDHYAIRPVKADGQPAAQQTLPFADVAQSDWFYSAVDYVYQSGAMKGVSGTQFSPNTYLSRSMVAQVLCNLEGAASGSGTGTVFSDVPAGTWYTGAVEWANAQGLMSGYGGKTFGPGDNVTREQLAAVFYRYAQDNGLDTAQGGNAAQGYSDYASVSSWARDAMNWAVSVGLIQGKSGNRLDPAGKASRAEAATILMRWSGLSSQNPADSYANSELTGASYQGITRVVINGTGLPQVQASDVKLKLADGTQVPASQIQVVSSQGNQVVLHLDSAATAQSSAANATVMLSGQGGQTNTVTIAANGDPLDEDVLKIINKGSTEDGNSLWHDTGTEQSVAILLDSETKDGYRYIKQKGTIRALMVVLDFPDAKAEDNTGVNGVPGKEPKDYGNRNADGTPLKTAQDYYDFLMPNAKQFFQNLSGGNMDLEVTLVENPNDPTGVFQAKNSLYGGLSTDDAGHTAFAMDRGGDVNSYLYDVAQNPANNFQKLLSSVEGEYDMLYMVAVENAPGISYGPMDTWGDTANALTGRTDLDAMVRIGFDSYSTWKYKGVTHETTHALGANDYYINAFSGYGGGQCDPVTGKADYYPYVGHWDYMGYINGPAPDIFGWMKWRFGWARDDQVDIVTSEGTTIHELAPLETYGGTKIVVLPSDVKGVSYVIENRQMMGADDTASTEDWDHIYGTFENPGILMYQINANTPTLSGGITIVDLYPDQTEEELAAALDKSVLGSTSGIMSYTHEASGITVKVLEEHEDGSVLIQVTKNTPKTQVKPVLSDFHFIDNMTLEFTSDVDLRGIVADELVVTKDGQPLKGVKINQILPHSVRITFNDGQVEPGDTLSVSTKAFMYYGASASYTTPAFQWGHTPVFSNVSFRDTNTITGTITDGYQIPLEQLVVTTTGGVLSTDQLDSFTNNNNGTFTLKLKDGALSSAADTVGVTLAAKEYTAYRPAELDIDQAQYRPQVVTSAAVAAVPVAELTTGLDSITIASTQHKTCYVVGDKLNTQGLVVKATFTDGKVAYPALSSLQFSGFDSSAPTGSQVITVTYGGKTAAYNIQVIQQPATIAVNGSGYKTTYQMGEALDTTGLTVSDGAGGTIAVSPADVSGFDSSVPGTYTLTIRLGTASVTYQVEVAGDYADFKADSVYKIVMAGASRVIDAYNDVCTWFDYATDVSSAANAGWKFVQAGEAGKYYVYSTAYNQYLKANGESRDVTLVSDQAQASVWSVLNMGEAGQVVFDTASRLCLYPVGTTDGDAVALTELEPSNSAIYWKVVELG